MDWPANQKLRPALERRNCPMQPQTGIHKKIHLYLTLCLMLFFPVLTAGQTQTGTTDQTTPNSDIPLLGDKAEAKLDAGHDKVSEKLLTTATWFDSFFDNQRYTCEKNETRAQMRLSVGKSRFSNWEFKPRVSLNLDLPQLENRAKLIISASDDEDFDIAQDPISKAAQTHSGSETERLNAALRYSMIAQKKMNLSSSVGVSFDRAYAGMRFRRNHKLANWRGRFISRLRWYTDNGWDWRNQYDIERPISKCFFLRTTAETYWAENQNGLPHALSLSLFQVLSQTNALAYDIGTYFQTRPNYHMTDLMLRLRLRQRFYRDWMVLEIGPQLTFPAQHNRRPNPGIVIKLEVDFGYVPEDSQISKICAF